MPTTKWESRRRAELVEAVRKHGRPYVHPFGVDSGPHPCHDKAHAEQGCVEETYLVAAIFRAGKAHQLLAYVHSIPGQEPYVQDLGHGYCGSRRLAGPRGFYNHGAPTIVSEVTCGRCLR